MDFTRRIELDLPYDEAIRRVKDALKDQGFGVLTEIDVRRTLKDKLDLDVEPQIILGACNPHSPTAPSRSTPASPRSCHATSWSAPRTATQSSKPSTPASSPTCPRTLP